MVIRRAVVAQLDLGRGPGLSPDGPGEPIVQRVTIVGRPPPTFTSSMGDHTTAFTVHVNAVQLALENLPVRGAAVRMHDLVNRLGTLPGTSLLPNLPSRQAKMLNDALERMTAANQAMMNPQPGANEIGVLQECVAAYLELRELVPLSTVNTGTISKATSGKGKGEDVGALRDQSAGVPQDKGRLEAELVGSLDIRAVALACIETDQGRLNELAPGLTVKMSGDERAFAYVSQHLVSLQSSFPGALSAFVDLIPLRSFDGDPAKDREAARDSDEKAIAMVLPDLLHRMVLPLAKSCLAEELPVQRAAVEAVRNDMRKLGPPPLEGAGTKRKASELDVGKFTKTAAEERKRLAENEASKLGRLNRIEAELELPATGAMTYDVDDGNTLWGRSSRNKPTEHYSPSVVNAQQKAQAYEVRTDREMAKQSAAPPRKKTAEQIEEENERVGALAVQVVLDDKGQITEMRTAGRPPSPFSGTMGAHTTAWTVHVDRVRQLILGKGLKAARTAVDVGLAKERAALVADLKPAFSFPKDHRSPAGTHKADEIEDVTSLQNAIVRHLEEVNLIPGATMPAADIDGKYEAGHRRVLLEHLGLQHFAGRQQAHTKPEMLAAVVGLVDVGSVESEGPSRFSEVNVDTGQRAVHRLVHAHLVAIDGAYPGALAAAGLGKPKDHRDQHVINVVKLLAEDKERPTKKQKKKNVKAAKQTKSAEVETMTLDTKVDPTEATSTFSFAWDATAFGTVSTTSYDEKASMGTRRFVHNRRTGIGTKPLAPFGKPWLDNDGNLLPDRLTEMVTAYRLDVKDAGTYLGQPEGGEIADEYGVAVDVYRDTAPAGYERIENVGGGDCLIHALADVKRAADLKANAVPVAQIPAQLGPVGGRTESSGKINAVRAAVEGRLDPPTVEHAVIDIVHNEIDGAGTPGLGTNVQRLLFNAGLQSEIANLSYRRERKRAEASIAKQEEEKKARAEQARAERSAKKLVAVADIGMDVEVKPDATLGPDGRPASSDTAVADTASGGIPIVAAQILPQERYPFNGEPDPDFALLHLNGNHYVALVKTSG
jgi:hypothetical protein